jgi:hypothetical protein
MKIEVGDREQALAIFRNLEPNPLLHTAGVDFTDSDVYRFLEKITNQLADSVEWQVVPNLPWDSWEVNQKGDIRHRQSKTVLTPEYDQIFDRLLVTVGDNERKYWINGPGLAETMTWEASNDAGSKDS